MSKENLHTLDWIETVLHRVTLDKVKTQHQEQEDLFANFILISSWQIHEIYREFTELNTIKQSDLKKMYKRFEQILLQCYKND